LCRPELEPMWQARATCVRHDGCHVRDLQSLCHASCSRWLHVELTVRFMLDALTIYCERSKRLVSGTIPAPAIGVHLDGLRRFHPLFLSTALLRSRCLSSRELPSPGLIGGEDREPRVMDSLSVILQRACKSSTPAGRIGIYQGHTGVHDRQVATLPSEI